MNVTEAEMMHYLEVFYGTLLEESRANLEPATAAHLRHAVALPARITAYISTQFGVALNYERLTKAETPNGVEIRTVRDSARAEDLLFETPAGLIPTPRNWALTINGAQQAWIQDAEFTCVDTPIHVVKPYTVVTLVNFTHHRPAFGSYPARTHVTEFAELYGERSAGFWSVTEASNRAKLEVLLAAHEVQRAQQLQVPIHEYIAHQKQLKVLVLGDYGHEGMERLSAIKVGLERLGYEPLLVQDIGDVLEMSLPGKVRTLGNIVRFVVIDDSTPSGHLSEVELCKQNELITVLLRAGGRGASYMTAGAGITSRIIHEKAYDPATPEPSLAEACRWAETTLQDLMPKFAAIYPWYPQTPGDGI